MKIILSQDVASLGKMGDVVSVKEGYARNFIIPQRKGYVATPDNLKRIEKLQAKQKAEQERLKLQAQEFAAKLSGVSCTISVEVNDLDKLYGAVKESEIVQVLHDEGFDVEKKMIVMDKPLDELGIFEVGIKVHPEVVAKIKVWVTKK